MKIHLIEPREGPDNKGSQYCLVCKQAVFNKDGSLAYDTKVFTHTTDVNTYNETKNINKEPPPPVEPTEDIVFEECLKTGEDK